MIAASVALIACGAFVGVKKSVANKSGDLLLANVEALASEASSGPYCYAGGKGSNSCSISAGVTIAGYGVAGGCSVSCGTGYYSCCTLRCTCEKS